MGVTKSRSVPGWLVGEYFGEGLLGRSSRRGQGQKRSSSRGGFRLSRGVRKFGHGRICREILLRGGQAQPTGSARETTFRSQRPLHQVPLTFQPATNGDPIPSARDIHARANGRE